LKTARQTLKIIIQQDNHCGGIGLCLFFFFFFFFCGHDKHLYRPFPLGEITFYPINYSPIFTFTSKISSVTLNSSKLLNCDNLTHLAYLFPKCPHHIFFFKKKIQKKKKKKKPNGWLASHLVWPGCGSATPKPAVWGQPNHPQWPKGWFGRPLGQSLKFLT
jgi:hypothetical protein